MCKSLIKIWAATYIIWAWLGQISVDVVIRFLTLKDLLNQSVSCFCMLARANDVMAWTVLHTIYRLATLIIGPISIQRLLNVVMWRTLIFSIDYWLMLHGLLLNNLIRKMIVDKGLGTLKFERLTCLLLQLSHWECWLNKCLVFAIEWLQSVAYCKMNKKLALWDSWRGMEIWIEKATVWIISCAGYISSTLMKQKLTLSVRVIP